MGRHRGDPRGTTWTQRSRAPSGRGWPRRRTGPHRPTTPSRSRPSRSAATSDPEFYALEQEHIWQRTWLFAGHVSQVAEPGSYLRFERSGMPDRDRAGRGRRDPRLLQQLSSPWRTGRARRVRHGQAPHLPVPLVVLRARGRAQGRSRESLVRRISTPDALGLQPVRCETYPGLDLRQRGPRRRAAHRRARPARRPDGRDRRPVAAPPGHPDPPHQRQLEGGRRRLPRGVPRPHRAPRQRRAPLRRPRGAPSRCCPTATAD